MSATPDPFPFTLIERAEHARLTPDVQRAFVAALARCGLVGRMADEVGVSVAAQKTPRYTARAQEFRGA